MRRLVSLVSGLVMVVAVVAGPPGAADADSSLGEGPVTLIAVDLGSASLTEHDAAVAVTALTVLLDAHTTDPVALLPYAASAGLPDGFAAGDTALDAAAAALADRIAERAERGESNQFRALATAFSYLSEQEAPAGSQMYLVTGRMQDGSRANRDRIAGFADLFAEQGWMISALMLPSSAPEARDFLVSIVERTGGAWDDAGTVEGLAGFTHRERGLAPAPALSIRLQPGASALQPLEVAPETELLVVTTTRASTAARVEVFDPEGARAMHAAGLYTIYETPAFVVKTFARPRPGTWLLRATGDGEPILASVELRNPLQLVLLPQPPLVAGETGILLAAATVDGEPRPLPGAEITVTVRDPAGASVVYRLNDGGIGGDETAGDGVFSVAYAASALQGVNDVALTLAWDGYGATLGANASLKTEVFPTITLLPGEGGTLDAGGQLAVGAIEVTVGEYPFPVLPEQISLVVTGPSGVPLTGLVEPLETLPDGRGWRFKIITWPSETGAHSVTAELTGDYLERGFSASGARVETPVTVLRYVPPPPEPVSRTRDVITAALIALAVTAVLALAVAAWRLWRQVRPYGYFYDDNRRLVLDLAAVRKPGLRSLFSRDRVTGDDAPTLPVPASTLVFTHDGPELRYDNDANPTLRVDGRPARAVEKLRDGTIIGFAGRLFEFALSRRPAPTPAQNPEPAAGD